MGYSALCEAITAGPFSCVNCRIVFFFLKKSNARGFAQEGKLDLTGGEGGTLGFDWYIMSMIQPLASVDLKEQVFNTCSCCLIPVAKGCYWTLAVTNFFSDISNFYWGLCGNSVNRNFAKHKKMLPRSRYFGLLIYNCKCYFKTFQA